MFEYSDGYGHGPGVGPGVALDAERENASFDVTAMTNMIYGGPEVHTYKHFKLSYFLFFPPTLQSTHGLLYSQL
jgi:hypothetical protein